MAKYVIDDTTLFAIGDAIREKEGTSEQIPVTEIASRISAIESGGSKITYRTPKEIYEQERPSNWPVLPDPEEGECYFLAMGSKNYLAIPPNGYTSAEYGYIDETGAFVVEQKQTVQLSSYWGSLGLGTNFELPAPMQEFMVIRVVGGNPTMENNTGTSKKTQTILEAKVNLPNATGLFNTKVTSSGAYKSLRFVTLYNKISASTTSLAHAFTGCSALKALIFDKEEDNFFTKSYFNGKIDLQAMFNNCYALEYAYSITEDTNVNVNLSNLFANCYIVKNPLTIESSTVTTATSLVNYCGAPELSIDLPACTSFNYLASYRQSRVKKLNLPKNTNVSLFNAGINAPIEILDLNLDALGSVNTVVKLGNYSSGSLLERVVFSENATKAPLLMKMDITSMSLASLEEFFNSLPPISNGAIRTITFVNYSSLPYSVTPPESFNIAINKGYTIAFAAS